MNRDAQLALFLFAGLTVAAVVLTLISIAIHKLWYRGHGRKCACLDCVWQSVQKVFGDQHPDVGFEMSDEDLDTWLWIQKGLTADSEGRRPA